MSIDTTYTKACTRCGEVKGAEGFHRNKREKDGLGRQCKSCVKAYFASLKVNPARLEAVAEIDFTTYTKACTKCKEVKAAVEFFKDKNKKDGLTSSCKSCGAAKAAANYEANKDRLKARQAEYRSRPDVKAKILAKAVEYRSRPEVKAKAAANYEANKDRLKARQAEYRSRPDVKAKAAANYEANKAKAAEYRSRPDVKAKAAADYEANKATIAARVAAYAKANPEKVRALRAKRRAAKLERTPNWLSKYELDYMTSIYAIAGQAQKIEGEEKHVDHLVPLRGKDVSGLHVPWNLVLLPAIDNIKKSNKFCINEYNARWHNT